MQQGKPQSFSSGMDCRSCSTVFCQEFLGAKLLDFDLLRPSFNLSQHRAPLIEHSLKGECERSEDRCRQPSGSNTFDGQVSGRVFFRNLVLFSGPLDCDICKSLEHRSTSRRRSSLTTLAMTSATKFRQTQLLFLPGLSFGAKIVVPTFESHGPRSEP